MVEGVTAEVPVESGNVQQKNSSTGVEHGLGRLGLPRDETPATATEVGETTPLVTNPETPIAVTNESSVNDPVVIVKPDESPTTSLDGADTLVSISQNMQPSVKVGEGAYNATVQPREAIKTGNDNGLRADVHSITEVPPSVEKADEQGVVSTTDTTSSVVEGVGSATAATTQTSSTIIESLPTETAVGVPEPVTIGDIDKTFAPVEGKFAPNMGNAAPVEGKFPAMIEKVGLTTQQKAEEITKTKAAGGWRGIIAGLLLALPVALNHDAGPVADHSIDSTDQGVQTPIGGRQISNSQGSNWLEWMSHPKGTFNPQTPPINPFIFPRKEPFGTDVVGIKSLPTSAGGTTISYEGMKVAQSPENRPHYEMPAYRWEAGDTADVGGFLEAQFAIAMASDEELENLGVKKEQLETNEPVYLELAKNKVVNEAEKTILARYRGTDVYKKGMQDLLATISDNNGTDAIEVNPDVDRVEKPDYKGEFVHREKDGSAMIHFPKGEFLRGLGKKWQEERKDGAVV